MRSIDTLLDVVDAQPKGSIYEQFASLLKATQNLSSWRNLVSHAGVALEIRPDPSQAVR